MMSAATVFFLVSVAAPGAAAPDRPMPPAARGLCRDVGPGTVWHKRDLPASVQRSIGFDLAESDGDYQLSDAVAAGPPLPFRRMICANPVPGGFEIQFERGGRGYSIGAVAVVRSRKGYVSRPTTTCFTTHDAEPRLERCGPADVPAKPPR